MLTTTPQSRAGNAVRCEHCDRPLHPEPGRRRRRFCGDTCRQAAHRSKKWHRVHVGPPLSRSVATDPVDAIENSLLAGLGDLGDLEPRRRDFWHRRARQAAEAIAAIRPDEPITTPVTINPAADPAIKAKADELIAQIPDDLSIPPFLKRGRQ